uniref:Uncharacterized protein n=1 Tax=Anguilla anguilla TaxID=7936 RepID=A0A0E9RA95_ANGAN
MLVKINSLHILFYYDKIHILFSSSSLYIERTILQGSVHIKRALNSDFSCGHSMKKQRTS